MRLLYITLRNTYRKSNREEQFSQPGPIFRSLDLLSSLNRNDKRECGGANKGNAREGGSVCAAASSSVLCSTVPQNHFRNRLAPKCSARQEALFVTCCKFHFCVCTALSVTSANWHVERVCVQSCSDFLNVNLHGKSS